MANTWSEVAAPLAGQDFIYCLAEFNGKVYGGAGDTAFHLFEWNGSNAWVDRASSIGLSEISALAVYENRLYGGGTRFMRWDNISAWNLIWNPGDGSRIMAFVVFQGNLYFSTYRLGPLGGRLYRWTGSGNPVIVANQLNGQADVSSLIVYKRSIYGGTSTGGRLFKWDGVDAWTEVAGQHEAQPNIFSLAEYEGKIYGGTRDGTKGMLFEWNGTDAWVTRAPRAYAQNHIYDLVVYHENKLLGGTGGDSNLFMWNGVNAWLRVAPQAGTQTSIRSLIEFEGKVYGGSGRPAGVGGRLYKWSSQFPSPPTDLLVCDKASSIGPDGECIPAIIDTIVPYFSAIFNHPHQHAVGKHYRIQVNTQYDLAGTVMWNSSKMPMADVAEGNRCENLWYGGNLLSIGVTYYWRIMFYDEDGFLGDWSEVNCFRIEFEDGDEPYPPIPPVPPKYKLRIGNNIIMCEADKQDMFEMHFTLRQNGGCCEFNLSLKAPSFVVNLGDQVCIYLFGSAVPWYRGRVLERDRPGSSNRVRKYSGYGHFEFLNGGDLVNRNYGTATANPSTIKLIVQDILATYVRLPGCPISGVNTFIQDVAGYNVTELHFDRVKPMDALTELCELAGNYEFGVDENGDLYFRSISTVITERKWVGKHLASYLPKEDMRKVVNYWYLEGGVLAAGSNYDSFIQNPASVTQWGQRSGKATVPDGFNNAEIARWGADLLLKTQDPIIKATISGIDIEQTQTRIWPRGQMRITSEDGTDVQDFPMKAVTYHITPAGITADVELGEKKPSPRDPIRAIEKQLHEEREQLAHDVAQLASGTAVTAIWDADTDTGIQLEKNADEDKIRFDIAGVERAVWHGKDAAGTVMGWWEQQFDNLLRGGSFESWSAGAAAIPDGFANEEFAANVTYSRSADEIDGIYALIVTTDGTGDGGPSQTLTLRSGRTYTMSVRAKISAGAPTFSFGYEHGVGNYVHSAVHTPGGAYALYIWTFVAAADTDFVFLRSRTASTDILFDSWLIVEGPLAPLFAMHHNDEHLKAIDYQDTTTANFDYGLLRMECGQAPNTDAAGNVTVTFGTAFTQILIAISDAAPPGPGVSRHYSNVRSEANNSMVIYVGDFAGAAHANENPNWIAIGVD